MEGCDTKVTKISQGELIEEIDSREESVSKATENFLHNGITDYDKHRMNHSVGVRGVKSESKSYVKQDGFAGFLQDPQDASMQQVALQKINGGISRRVTYAASGKHALRQQARRRRRNTSIAAGNSPPITRVTMKSSGSSAACSPSGLSPTGNQSAVVSAQSQCSPQSSSGKLLHSSPTQIIDQLRSDAKNTSEESITDNMARIIVNKLTPSIYDKITLDNGSLNATINDLNSMMENNKFQGRHSPNIGSKVSPNLSSSSSTIRASSRLMNINSSTPSTVVSTNSPSTQPATRTLRVSVPQSSPSTRDVLSPSLTTMQSILASIPGFKPRKRSQRKLSTAAQIAQTKEGSIDLETSDSILVNVNLKSLVNADTYMSLSLDYQHRLAQFLPRVDQITNEDDSVKASPTSFHNEFLARACVSWRERLREGEFTHDNQVKLKGEAEKEKSKLDPWKVAHFEPVWGMKQHSSVDINSEIDSSLSMYEASTSMNSFKVQKPPPSEEYLIQLSKVVGFIASRDQRRERRREAKRLESHQEQSCEDEPSSPVREFLVSSVDSDIIEIHDENVESVNSLKRKASPELAEPASKKSCSSELSPESEPSSLNECEDEFSADKFVYEDSTSNPIEGPSSSIADQYSPSNEHSTSMADQYSSSNEQLTPVADQYASSNEHSTPMADQYSPSNEQSTPMADQYSFSNEHLSPIADQYSSSNDQASYSPANDNTTLVADHYSSLSNDQSNPRDDQSLEDNSIPIEDNSMPSEDHLTPSDEHLTPSEYQPVEFDDKANSLECHPSSVNELSPSTDDQSIFTASHNEPMEKQSSPPLNHSFSMGANYVQENSPSPTEVQSSQLDPLPISPIQILSDDDSMRVYSSVSKSPPLIDSLIRSVPSQSPKSVCSTVTTLSVPDDSPDSVASSPSNRTVSPSPDTVVNSPTNPALSFPMPLMSPSSSPMPLMSPSSSPMPVMSPRSSPMPLMSPRSSPMPVMSPRSSPVSVIIKSPTTESPAKKVQGPSYGSPVTLRISKARAQGGVNLQRSYEIVQGVIANSPNRDQLQAQLKPSAVLLHSPKDSAKAMDHKIQEKDVFQCPQFVAPQSIPSSSMHPQTLTVLKAVHNGQSQLLPTGQRVFRSVALPFAAIRSITPDGSAGHQQMNAQSIPQTREGYKAPFGGSSPITILRPASGGKPVFLRTLSVSNIHLVRVSDILNNARSDGEQPPRASSAPPSRNDLATVVPRPNSVGSKILIPTSSQISSSSPSPTRHFLSEGDPSSCVSNSNSDDTNRAGATPNVIPQQFIIFKPNPVISTAVSNSCTNVTAAQSEFRVNDNYTVGHDSRSSSVTASSRIGNERVEDGESFAIPESADLVGMTSSRGMLHPSEALNPIAQSSYVNQHQMMQKRTFLMQHQNLNRGEPTNAYENANASNVALFTNNNQLDSSDQDESEEGCPCNMRAMVACVKCGAFCHHDCVSPNRLCVTCLIR